MRVKTQSLSATGRVCIYDGIDHYYIHVEDKRSKVTVDGKIVNNAKALFDLLFAHSYDVTLSRDKRVLNEVLVATFKRE